jgi:hypothetical protein
VRVSCVVCVCVAFCIARSPLCALPPPSADSTRDRNRGPGPLWKRGGHAGSETVAWSQSASSVGC